MDTWFAEGLAELYGWIRDSGLGSEVTDNVEHLLGRKATQFRQFAADERTACFGPAVICCVLGVISLARWNREGNAYLFAGSAFYAQRFRSGNSHFLNDYIFFWNILMSA